MTFNRTLDALLVGEEGVIEGVGGALGFRRRLLELGLVPGTRVVRTGQAPLGDPLRFRMRDTSLSLRRVDAASIGVVPRGETQ